MALDSFSTATVNPDHDSKTTVDNSQYSENKTNTNPKKTTYPEKRETSRDFRGAKATLMSLSRRIKIKIIF